MNKDAIDSFKQCCSAVAMKHGLGKSLVTGHKAGYWEEAAEMYVAELKKENEQLKKQISRLRPRRLIDQD